MVPSIHYGTLDSLWYPRFTMVPSIHYGTLDSLRYPWLKSLSIMINNEEDIVFFLPANMAMSNSQINP